MGVGAEESGAEVYQQQMRRGFRWLRFDLPEVEQAFRHDLLESVVIQRQVLLLVGVVLIGIMPVLDAWLLDTPSQLRGPFRVAQFGFMIPSLLLTAAVTATAWRHQFGDILGAICALVLTAGLLFQRSLGAANGFEVPSELVAVVVAGVFLIAAIRFYFFLPTMLLIVLAFSVNEFQAHGVGPASIYTVNAMVMLLLVCGIGAYIHEHAARASWLRTRILQALSQSDPLTGMLNSRAFDTAYQQLHALAVRERRPLAIALADVDFFKDYNDTYGHPAGDDVLVQVAEQISAAARRDSDLRARIGGEEFVVVWYGLDLEQVRRQSERMRAEVEALQIEHQGSQLDGKRVTVSVGATWMVPSAEISARQLLQSADQRLYLAKNAGRNQVVLGTTVKP